MNQLNEQQMHQHVTILGWLFVVTHAVLLLLGLCGLLFFAGVGAIAGTEGDLTALGILGIVGLASLLFFAVLALPGIFAGYGLLRRENWGRILALVVGILSLFNAPIGTLIGIYTLFVLFQNAAEPYFSAERPG